MFTLSMIYLLGQEILLIISKFKNCLFVATNTVKNSDKEKYVYKVCGITFDIAVSWNFDNDTARKVITFGDNNNSSSHVENVKENFLMLDLRPPHRISGSWVHQRKRLVLCLLNQIINFS